jgi:hypothetical protein
MKRILFFLAAMLLSGLAFADDMVLRGDAGTYRLTQAKCALPIAIASVKPEYAENHRAGRLEREGSTLEFCWIVVGDKVFAMDETGELHVGPISAFKRAPSI